MEALLVGQGIAARSTAAGAARTADAASAETTAAITMVKRLAREAELSAEGSQDSIAAALALTSLDAGAAVEALVPVPRDLSLHAEPPCTAGYFPAEGGEPYDPPPPPTTTSLPA